MRANSAWVRSSQTQPHVRLAEIVERHRLHAWRRPVSELGQKNFAGIAEWLNAQGARPIVVDSGCGTGESARQYAAMNPQSSVLGADRSLARLSRSGIGGDTALHIEQHLCLARINLEDLWPQLASLSVRLSRHHLWYPNPSPKPEHLRRRWHAHGVFPILLMLGGEIEVRGNWRIYIDEFAIALRLHGHDVRIDEIGECEAVVTPFERKYRASGQTLWRLRCKLD